MGIHNGLRVVELVNELKLEQTNIKKHISKISGREMIWLIRIYINR